jgi:hypothetical protein
MTISRREGRACPAITFLDEPKKNVDARDKRGHDD